MQNWHFGYSVKSLESSQRHRAPFAVAVCTKLQNWSPMASDARLLTVWLHLVAIMYYIGSPGFVEEVLLSPPDWEATSCPQVFVKYLNGEIDDCTQGLAERLRAYALSRQSLRRWFDWTDGTRLHVPKVPASCTQFSLPGCARTARSGFSRLASFGLRS